MAITQENQITLIFRCAPELAAILPPPIPAVQGLPEWLKAMPQNAFNPVSQTDTQTVKRCPPFIDAMTYGFLMPLACDLKVENGEFSWDFDIPPGPIRCARSPIGFHDASQDGRASPADARLVGRNNSENDVANTPFQLASSPVESICAQDKIFKYQPFGGDGGIRTPDTVVYRITV